MSNTINIDVLEQFGACQPQCIVLREIYPSGVVTFDDAHYPKIKEREVNVLWATPLLPRAVQLELALKWYDRALAAATPDWKSALRALVAAPASNGASQQLGARLADRRAVDASDVTGTTTAGVGYAAAALSGKYAEVPLDVARTMTAMVVMAQWCAQAAAIAESKTMETVLDAFQAEVWHALSEHGATVPQSLHL